MFVVNAGLFLFASSFIDGFTVDGFWYALLGSLLMSIVNLIGSRWLRPAKAQNDAPVTYREVREEN